MVLKILGHMSVQFEISVPARNGERRGMAFAAMRYVIFMQEVLEPSTFLL